MDKQEAEQKKIEAVIEGARAEALEFAKGKTVAELTESLVDLYFHLYAEREQSRFAIRISECTAAILDGAYKQMRDAGIEPDKSIALQQKRLLDAEVAEHTALMMKLQERAERFAADEAKAEALKPLKEGRVHGSRNQKAEADKRKSVIAWEVNRWLNSPDAPIGFDLPPAKYAEVDDFVTAIKRVDIMNTFKVKYADRGLKDIVSPIVTKHRNG